MATPTSCHQGIFDRGFQRLVGFDPGTGSLGALGMRQRGPEQYLSWALNPAWMSPGELRVGYKSARPPRKGVGRLALMSEKMRWRGLDAR